MNGSTTLDLRFIYEINLLRSASAFAACAIICGSPIFNGIAWAADDNTVKVGVLHSLSGTMAISETSLRDMLLFAFDEINKSGGVAGQARSSPYVVDGASNWPLFAEKAKQLLEEDQVRRSVRLLDLGEPQIGSARV